VPLGFAPIWPYVTDGHFCPDLGQFFWLVAIGTIFALAYLACACRRGVHLLTLGLGPDLESFVPARAGDNPRNRSELSAPVATSCTSFNVGCILIIRSVPGHTKGSPSMKRSLRVAVVLAAVTALLSGIALSSASADGANDRWANYGPTYVLNPSGGVNGTDGMRITFGGSQLAVQRMESPTNPGAVNNETYGRYSLPGSSEANGVLNHIALAVGDQANGGTAFITPAYVEAENDWVKIRHADNVTVLPWVIAAASSPTQIVQTLTGVVDSLTYTVVVTIDYTAPEDRMKVSYQVVIPEGNTKPVRLYHLIDTYLGGSDQGPGFFTDPVTCGVSGESGAIVGVDRAEQGIVEAFQFISGTPWAGYMSAYYADVVFGTGSKTNPATNDAEEEQESQDGPRFGPGYMNDLNNQIITDPENDNGIGINWNFGSSAGSYSSVAKLIFSSATVEPCNDPEAVSPTNPDPTEVPDPIIDPVAPDAEFDPLKDPEPIVEIVAPSFTG